ncbi:flagellar motor switch protein FliN [Candidatus Margulisiibacteriota bacterium]
MEVKKVHFPELEEQATGASLTDKTLGEIPIEVAVELGRTKLTLREILELKEGAIIELDRLAGEPLDLKVGGQLIAQGEVVAIDDSYGLRITNVVIQ